MEGAARAQALGRTEPGVWGEGGQRGGRVAGAECGGGGHAGHFPDWLLPGGQGGPWGLLSREVLDPPWVLVRTVAWRLRAGL